MYGTETRSKNVSTGSINITKKQKVSDNNVTNTGAAVMSFIQMPNKLVHVPNKLNSICIVQNSYSLQYRHRKWNLIYIPPKQCHLLNNTPKKHKK